MKVGRWAGRRVGRTADGLACWVLLLLGQVAASLVMELAAVDSDLL